MVRMGPCLSSYTCYSLLTNYGHAFRQHKVVLLFTAVLSFSTEHRASAPPPYAGSYQQYTPPAAGPAYPDTAPPQYDNQQPYGGNQGYGAPDAYQYVPQQPPPAEAGLPPTAIVSYYTQENLLCCITIHSLSVNSHLVQNVNITPIFT